MQLSVEKKSSKAKLYSPTQRRGRVVAAKAVEGSAQSDGRDVDRTTTAAIAAAVTTKATAAVAARVIQARALCYSAAHIRITKTTFM